MQERRMPLFDLVIKNGFVVDGTGKPGFNADVAVKDGRIAIVGSTTEYAARTIDAEGLVVSPGFIDIHSHTDELVIANPTCESKLTQGVTTEVSGNCGDSAAPRGGKQNLEEASKWLTEYGINLTWRSLDEYFDVLESIQMAVNCITLVGNGTLRSVVMGNDDRPATPSEISEMRRLVEESMKAGAFGLSSGLIYPPSCYADTEELIELCKGVAPFGGFYASHIRNESERLCEAVEEAITIGKEAGVGVQISHHKACGKPNWGLVNESLALIDKARAEGLDVWADQYPYVATSTGLGIMFPKWAYAGGNRSLTERLRDADERSKIRDEMISNTESGWIKDSCGWEAVVISSVREECNKHFEGRSIAEIAQEQGKHPVDIAIDLMLSENGHIGMVHFVINEDDVKRVMAHPAVLIGSDATARATTGPLNRGKPHPRAFGTFARVLGKYVREEKVLTLEQAVAKMTGLTAQRLGLANRGIIAEGFWADITIFDAETISDAATFKEPLTPAIGIKYVVVNGKVCVDDGRIVDSGLGAGRVIRRGRDR